MMANERGFALVLVLSFAAVIGALSANMLIGLRETGYTTHASEQHLIRRLAIDSAIDIAASRLRDPGAEPFTSMAFEIGNINIDIALTAESDRIDLNSSTIEEFQDWIAAILKEAEIEDDDLSTVLAHRLVDWRDADDLRQLQGAEERDYARAGLDYAPSDGPFRHVHELRDVMGVNADLFELLQASASVATGKGQALDLLDEPVEGEDVPETTDNELNTAQQDEANIYRLRIDASSKEHGRLMSEVVIWSEPADDNADYQILDYQPFILPGNDEPDGDLDGSDPVGEDQ